MVPSFRAAALSLDTTDSCVLRTVGPDRGRTHVHAMETLSIDIGLDRRPVKAGGDPILIFLAESQDPGARIMVAVRMSACTTLMNLACVSVGGWSAIQVRSHGPITACACVGSSFANGASVVLLRDIV